MFPGVWVESCWQYAENSFGLTIPESGTRRRAAMRASVLFPHPLSPMTPVHPVGNVALTSLMAGEAAPG